MKWFVEGMELETGAIVTVASFEEEQAAKAFITFLVARGYRWEMYLGHIVPEG